MRNMKDFTRSCRALWYNTIPFGRQTFQFYWEAFGQAPLGHVCFTKKKNFAAIKCSKKYKGNVRPLTLSYIT